MLRTRRTTRGTSASVIATMTFPTLALVSAMSAIARSTEGIDISPSITRMTVASTQRTNPVTRPITRPRVMDRAATAAPTVSEMREPKITRLYTSRPSMSVPNQCPLDGCVSRWIGESACGSEVASQGASSAIRTIATSTAAPAIAVGCRRKASRKRCHVGDMERGAAIAAVFMSVLDTRVEQPVGEINSQIDEYVDSWEEEDHTLND